MTIEAGLAASDPAAAPSITPDVVAPLPPAKTFGALKATIAFFVLFFAQFVTGIAVFMIAMIVAAVRGADITDGALLKQLTNDITVPLLLTAAGVSTVVVFAVARGWAWHLVLDHGDAGLGVVRARWQHVVAWAIAGAVVSAAYFIVATRLVPFDASTPLGPLAAVATRGGLERLTWALLALIFAPVVEEFFFRGLLLSGFTHTWGRLAGGITVTVLFVVMHLFETFRYWPATVAVTVLAIGTLAARRMTGSLTPAVAYHGAYNLVIVVVAFAARGMR